MSALKLCKDCKWSKDDGMLGWICEAQRPDNVSPIDGRTVMEWCERLRKSELPYECGRKGKWFEPKAPVKPVSGTVLFSRLNGKIEATYVPDEEKDTIIPGKLVYQQHVVFEEKGNA